MCAYASPEAFDKILTLICSKLFTSINFTTVTRKFRESRAATATAAVKLYILRTILIIHDPHFSKQNNTLSIVGAILSPTNSVINLRGINRSSFFREKREKNDTFPKTRELLALARSCRICASFNPNLDRSTLRTSDGSNIEAQYAVVRAFRESIQKNYVRAE